MVLDSNLLIYAAELGYDEIRRFIAQHESYLSVISKIEVLGYHQLPTEQRQKLEKLFEIAMILPLTAEIVEAAITLRQQRNMSLGDSIIAATAMVHEMTLATANIHDFEWIENLQLINPLNEHESDKVGKMSFCFAHHNE